MFPIGKIEQNWFGINGDNRNNWNVEERNVLNTNKTLRTFNFKIYESRLSYTSVIFNFFY